MALCRGPVHVPKTQAVPLGGMGIGGQHQQSYVPPGDGDDGYYSL